MSDPPFPAALPQPTLTGYIQIPSASFVRTQMEAGPARQRRVFTSSHREIHVRWLFNPLQWSVFASWYYHYLKGGSIWFVLSLLSARGLQDLRVRFTRPYTARRTAGNTREIRALLETPPQAASSSTHTGATSIFPSTLPPPSRSSSLQPAGAFLRSDIESASVRQQSTFSTNRQNISVQWFLRTQEMVVFEDWYRTRNHLGAGWFMLALPDGEGLVSKRARFTDSWRASPYASGWWEVRADLETVTLPHMTLALLESLVRESPELLEMHIRRLDHVLRILDWMQPLHLPALTHALHALDATLHPLHAALQPSGEQE